MAWTTPLTWSGVLVTVSNMNTHVRDNLLAILPAGPAYTAVAHSAGNFTGSGTITWTVASGDQSRFSYVEIGKTMIVSLYLTSTTISGTGTELRVAVPNGRTAQGGYGAYFAANATTAGAGLWVASGTYIQFYRPDLANWPSSTDATNIYATCVFEVA